MDQISWDDFSKIELRAGTIVEAQPFPEARKPAYILHIDLGEDLGIKKSSAQITENYTVKELKGKQVICVVNFPEKQIGPVRSQVLVTGFADQNGQVVLASPRTKVPNGAKLH
ncbi:MAG: tRNA-binding protein [Fulvivirga sp.]|nr:tRNA-binding protein [Fulvivirga sp.]